MINQDSSLKFNSKEIFACTHEFFNLINFRR